jgi:hypothetical protein
MGNTHENIHQQLSRSYSLELPVELTRNHFTLPSFDNPSPQVRYTTNQQMNKQRGSKEKYNRLSLNNGPVKNSQASLQNRTVYRLLT